MSITASVNTATRLDGPLVVSRGEQQSQPTRSIGARGRIKAARRATEGLGLYATIRPATLARSLSAKAFLAGSPDGRARLAPFPLAGRGGG